MINTSKSIIVSCDTLVTGGAETFAMRMAKYYKERGHRVVLFSVLGDKIDLKLVKQNAGHVEVLTFLPPKLLNWLLYKIDGLLYRAGIYKGLRRYLTIVKCKSLIRSRRIQMIHTNMFASLDIFNHAALKFNSVKLIHTVHADILGLAYLVVSRKTNKMTKYDRYCVNNLLPQILQRVNYIVVPAEMHLKIFGAWSALDISKVVKIYYPVDRAEPAPKAFLRTGLNIPMNAFVFGSVARAIPQKGWEQLIKAFIQAGIPNTFLVLVGDGPFLQYLKSTYGEHQNILYAGNQPDTLPYLNLFDVGISASFFWESLPTVIIDYLSLSIPIICTDNAESRYMVKSAHGSAGVVVPLRKDEWEVVEEECPLSVSDLQQAIYTLYHDAPLRETLSNNAGLCFEKFRKEEILKKYEELF